MGGQARHRRESREVAIETSQLTRLAIGGALAAAVVGAVWYWPVGAPAATAPDSPVVVTTAPAHGVTIHVSGAVAAPGLVEVPVGARVADAIAAAGGVLPGADVTTLNLAAPVGDGEQVRVLEASHSAVGGGAGGGGPPDDGLIHVNIADIIALQELPGVGPVLAGRIVAYRDEHGPFADIEDLLDVPGIGEGRLEAMRDVVAIP